MNECIKELIKYKVKVADSIIKHLPTPVSKEIREVGKIIVEEFNNTNNSKKQSSFSIDRINIE